MANQERGEVSVEVEGQRYTLRPSLNAFCEVEDLTGKSFAEIAGMADRGRVSAMRALLWSFLQAAHGDEIKTLADAGAWMDRAGGLAGITAKFHELTRLNAEPEEPGRKVNGRPPRAQGRTGAPSSQTPGATPT